MNRIHKGDVLLTEDKERIDRLNLVLRTIRNVNRLIVREQDRDNLLQGICDNLIENRGYYNAWIALWDNSPGPVAFAEAGLGDRFLQMVERIETGRLTRCTQEALKNDEAVITEDPVSTCQDCPLSSGYMGRGAMTARLEYRDRIYGILCVSIPRELITDKEERSLFKEIAEDIALGLYRIEMIEARDRFENELQKSEQRFRNLVEHSLVGVSILQDEEVVYQNPEQERLLGPLPRKCKVIDLENIHPDDTEKVERFYQKIATGKVSLLDTDFRFYSTDNTGGRADMKWVLCRATSVEYRGKDAVMMNIMDITKTKELEKIVRVQDKMSSLGRVAAGIAHEIRNPLSGMNIYLNTLNKIYNRAENLDKVQRIIERLQSASGKIESVVKRVMDFSKPGEPTFAFIDVNIPVEEAIKLSSVTLWKRGIELESRLARDLPPCYIDSTMIEEVILNLITNAAEAMQNTEGDRRIDVATCMENNHVVLRICDSGPGVPQSMRDKIFDPFYSTKNGSTGIGLSLVQRIIADHKGSLDIVSSNWGGAEFKIMIPVKKGMGTP